VGERVANQGDIQELVRVPFLEESHQSEEQVIAHEGQGSKREIEAERIHRFVLYHKNSHQVGKSGNKSKKVRYYEA
jgi:hypothetical protein